MKQSIRKIVCIIMAAMLFMLALNIGAAAETAPTPVIISYESSQTRITRGRSADISVLVKDTSVPADEIADVTAEIDADHLIDSFTGGTVSIEADPDIGTQLSYIVKFENLVYSGTGQTLKFMVGYNGSYSELSVEITQAVPYDDSEPIGEPYVPDPIPEPTIIVHRGDIEEPVEAGQEFDVTVSFENLSNTTLKNVVATCSPTEPLLMAGGTSSFAMENIGGKKTAAITFRLKAMDEITSSNLTVGVELKYTYYNDVSNVTATVSERINIPAKVTRPQEQPTVTVPEPPVIITRSALSPISANQTFGLDITFQNAGKTKIVSPVASFSASEALLLLNETSTVVLPDIEAGESASVTLRFRAASEINSSTQSVNADIKYYYDNGNGLVQSSASEHINISANVTQPPREVVRPDSPVPNLIIRDFGFGGDSVAAGEPFDLYFTFTNTGRLSVENIVVVVDGGESFTMNGSTNTFYYNSLVPGGDITQTVPMQTLAGARTGAQTVNVSFRYEYLDDSRRASTSADIKLSVPVFQPDRLQIDDPKLYDVSYAGMETTIVMSYINKGKSDMSNVEVSIEGEGVDILQPTQYLGNFTSGQSGNISFVVTPWNPGQTDLLIKVTYEDANLRSVTREFPFALDVQEMNWGWEEPGYIDEPEIGGEEKSGPGIWLWIIIAAIVLLALAILFAIVKKNKKKKKAAMAQDDEWDSWADDAAENAKAGSKEE